MDVAAHQLGHRVVHHAVARQRREARELTRDDANVEVPPLAGAGVAGMQGAVVADVELRRLEPGKPLAQPGDAVGGGHEARYHSGWPARFGPQPDAEVPVSLYLPLHPVTPQIRMIRQAVDLVRQGGVIAYPTDSCYALGCHIGDKDALERIRRIRKADRHHHFTLVCRDLTEIARYAKVETWQFRMLKAATPGPYTFLLPATREVPRRLQHEKRRTIGLRIPDHPVPQLLLQELGEPLMSSTLMLPGDELPLTDGEEIRERLDHDLDAILDGGHCGIEPTTVVDMVSNPPVITRVGRGSVAPFGLSA